MNSHWENWEQSGYDLNLNWDTSTFDSAANLSITALVYREEGAGASWEEVYVIDDMAENTGRYEFEGTPVYQVNQDNAFGAIRIRSSDDE